MALHDSFLLLASPDSFVSFWRWRCHFTLALVLPFYFDVFAARIIDVIRHGASNVSSFWGVLGLSNRRFRRISHSSVSFILKLAR